MKMRAGATGVFLLFSLFLCRVFALADVEYAGMELVGISQKTITFYSDVLVHAGDEFQIVRGDEVIALIKVAGVKGKLYSADIIKLFQGIDFDDKLVRFTFLPPAAETQKPPETVTQAPVETKKETETLKEDTSPAKSDDVKEDETPLPQPAPSPADVLEGTTQPPEALPVPMAGKKSAALRPVFSMQTLVRSASKEGMAATQPYLPQDTADNSVTDVFYEGTFKVMVPYKHSRNVYVQSEYMHKSGRNEKAKDMDFDLDQASFRFIGRFPKFDSTLGYSFMDMKPFYQSGIVSLLAAMPVSRYASSQVSVLYENRTANKKEFAALKGENQEVMISLQYNTPYNVQLRPSYKYENFASTQNTSSYFSHVGGVSVEFRGKQKVSSLMSYQYRTRKYKLDRTDIRNYLSFQVQAPYNDMLFIVNYTWFKNRSKQAFYDSEYNSFSLGVNYNYTLK